MEKERENTLGMLSPKDLQGLDVCALGRVSLLQDRPHSGESDTCRLWTGVQVGGAPGTLSTSLTSACP